MIAYVQGGLTTYVNVWKFPDGGVGVNINTGDTDPVFEQVDVDVLIEFGHMIDQRGKEVNMSDQIIALMQTMDALRSHFLRASFKLMIPYLPYARQDRVCVVGEGHSLRVMAQVINSLNFDSVVVVDPHSTVAEALINKMFKVTQYDLFKDIYLSWRDVHIVAPDQGATKKCQEFANKVGAAGVITCIKTRKDGEVELKVLDEIPQHAKLLVLDDICDGGKTFIEVANAVDDVDNRVSELSLAVSHGLFTQGVEKVAHHYDMIYTTDFFNSNKKHDKVIIVR